MNRLVSMSVIPAGRHGARDGDDAAAVVAKGE
jgi:hypothetical protein